METAAEYIQRINQYMRTHLKDDPTGFCIVFATQVRTRLTNERRRSSFLIFQDRIGGRLDYHFKILRPTLYKGKVSFGGHTVCISGRDIYDPLIGKIVSLQEYSASAFGREIPFRRLSSAEESSVIHYANELINLDFLRITRPAFLN